jgi:putative DNA primase/helicase
VHILKHLNILTAKISKRKNKQADGPTREELDEGNRNFPNNLPDHHTEEEQSGGNVLEIKPFNDWLKESQEQPDPVRIFGPLLHTQEVAILFGGAKSGKSALAVQLANAYAAGESVPGFENQAKEAGRVLFLDFELSKKQNQKRYEDPTKGLKTFSGNLDRAELKPENIQDNLAEQILDEVEAHAPHYDLIIIDNLTYILFDGEKSSNSATLIKRLQNIKKAEGCAVLVIAHTPKRVERAQSPLSIHDLAGSSQLGNLSDSVFGINRNVQSEDIRYVKQIVSRDEIEQFDADNVVTLQYDKEDNFLSFTYLRNEPERNHLKDATEEEKDQELANIKDLLNQGYSIRDVGKKLDVGRRKVEKIKKQLDGNE